MPCIKTHKEAAGLYGKSFPFFNDLAPVFAKDRAQGNARGDLGDDAEQYMHDSFAHMDDNANFVPLSSDDSFMPMDDHIDSPPPNSCDNCASSSIGRKRKNCVKEQNITAISAKFHHFVDLVGPGFKTLAECAVRDSEAKAYMVAARKEVDERKKLLNDVIFNIHGLTEDEALMVMQILRKDEEQLNMFWELPDERKLRFCRLLLGRMPNHPPM